MKGEFVMSEKRKLDMKMFSSVNTFNGIDRNNLVVEGETDVYVPFVIKQLWFRSVHQNGCIKTCLVTSFDDIAKYKICVFSSEVYVGNDLLAVGYGSANADEESFIEVAERRAVGKALSNAGFTWHTGDFSKDMDVVKMKLNIYNNYINAGLLDITDIQINQLYEDALETILPDGYGEDSGKSIAAMNKGHMENIAKNYAIINTGGDLLVNAQIKFVHLYQSLQEEKDKKPAVTSDELLPNIEIEAEENKPTKRGSKSGKKTKGKKQENNPEKSDNSVPMSEGQPADEAQPVEMVQPADEAQPVEMVQSADEAQSVEVVQPANEAQPVEIVQPADEAQPVEVVQPAEVVQIEEKVSSETLQNIFNLPTSDENDDFNNEDWDEQPFPTEWDKDFYLDANEIDDPIFKENLFDDLTPEVQQSLKEWGYTSQEELTSNWKAHFLRVRNMCQSIDWHNIAEAKEFVEKIPVYHNCLSPENAEKDHIVLLGDVLKQKDKLLKDEVPIATLKPLVEWYNQHI